MVYVDLVPAFDVPDFQPDLPLPFPVSDIPEYHLFPKRSRRVYQDDYKQFQESHACAEIAVVRALPITIRHGLRIAKALRIAAISRPGDLEPLQLAGSVNFEDFITSYMLKTCLFHTIRRSIERGNAYDWAERIYGELLHRIENRVLHAHFSDLETHYVFQCGAARYHEDGDQPAACCLKRNVILALTRTILKWLRHNKPQLESLTYGKLLVYSRNTSEYTHRLTAKQWFHLRSVNLVQATYGSIQVYSRKGYSMKTFLSKI